MKIAADRKRASGLDLRQHPAPLEAGTVVSVSVAAGCAGTTALRYGVVADRPDEYGLPIVIVLPEQMGRVWEESWVGFTRARPARVHAPGAVPRSAVYEAAKALLYRSFLRADAGPLGVLSMLGIDRAYGEPEASAETGVVAGAPMLFVRRSGGG
jgi:hypothetical protein